MQQPLEMTENMQKYKSPFLLFNGHLATVYPALFRKVPPVKLYSERISTPDDDFLELDWIKQGNTKLVIISHGLEGNSRRHYMIGMAKAFSAENHDVLLWNYRSCGSEMNKALRFYHSGATDDLQIIINHAIAQNYSEIVLIGFSLGGNLILKYLGENCKDLSVNIKKGIAFSVPCDLSAGAEQLSKWFNKLYSNRFLNSLKLKIIEKSKNHVILQEKLYLLKGIKTLKGFDNAFTAPLHGFEDAEDYYRQCSSINYISSINVPVLIVNSLDDPFLSKKCYPVKEAANNKNILLELPERGGHCGFSSKGPVFWSESRATLFCRNGQLH